MSEKVIVSDKDRLLRTEVLVNPRFHLVESNVLKWYITTLRDRETDSDTFARIVARTANFLWYEAARDMPLTMVPVTTPLDLTCEGYVPTHQDVVVIILRAGMAMAEIRKEIDHAVLGIIGMKRHERNGVAFPYLNALPEGISNMTVYLVDPMCATGGSYTLALNMLRQMGVKHVKCLSLFAVPEGVKVVLDNFPEAEMYTAALDKNLNERFYIQEGCGDAGDRWSGAKMDSMPLAQFITDAMLEGIAAYYGLDPTSLKRLNPSENG